MTTFDVQSGSSRSEAGRELTESVGHFSPRFTARSVVARRALCLLTFSSRACSHTLLSESVNYVRPRSRRSQVRPRPRHFPGPWTQAQSLRPPPPRPQSLLSEICMVSLLHASWAPYISLGGARQLAGPAPSPPAERDPIRDWTGGRLGKQSFGS